MESQLKYVRQRLAQRDLNGLDVFTSQIRDQLESYAEQFSSLKSGVISHCNVSTYYSQSTFWGHWTLTTCYHLMNFCILHFWHNWTWYFRFFSIFSSLLVRVRVYATDFTRNCVSDTCCASCHHPAGSLLSLSLSLFFIVLTVQAAPGPFSRISHSAHSRYAFSLVPLYPSSRVGPSHPKSLSPIRFFLLQS